jgi:hypothetical protein
VVVAGQAGCARWGVASHSPQRLEPPQPRIGLDPLESREHCGVLVATRPGRCAQPAVVFVKQVRPAACEQLSHRGTIVLRCQQQGCHAVDVLGIDGGTRAKHRFERLERTGADRRAQRCAADVVAVIGIGSVVEQQGNHLCAIGFGGVVKRHAAVDVRQLNVRARGEQAADDPSSPLTSRDHQRRPAVAVEQIGIRRVSQENIDGSQRPEVSSEHHRRRPRLWVLLIYRGTRPQQTLDLAAVRDRRSAKQRCEAGTSEDLFHGSEESGGIAFAKDWHWSDGPEHDAARVTDCATSPLPSYCFWSTMVPVTVPVLPTLFTDKVSVFSAEQYEYSVWFVPSVTVSTPPAVV